MRQGAERLGGALVPEPRASRGRKLIVTSRDAGQQHAPGERGAQRRLNRRAPPPEGEGRTLRNERSDRRAPGGSQERHLRSKTR